MIRHFCAPAKINLCLHVLGKRPDGYHDLAMIMQRVSLYDRVTIHLTEGSEIRVACPGVDLPPGGENIAGRAAAHLLALAGENRRVEVVIEKRIPVAAGLGGGSSDAATVLMGLNDMLGLGLSPGQLRQEGVKLGADVPFFLFQGAAWATGIGDVLEKVDGLPAVWYLLVNPGLAVSTAWVYQNLGLTTPGDVTKLHKFPRTAAELAAILHNDLERVTVARYPLISEIKRRLTALGARGALMSGSGPTVFGVFDAEAPARRAADLLAGESGWKVFVVQPLADSL